MNRRQLLGITAMVMTPFVAGCSGDSSGEDDSEPANVQNESQTTIKEESTTTTDGKITTEATSESEQMINQRNTTVRDPSAKNRCLSQTPTGMPAQNGLAIVGIYPTSQQRDFISGEYVVLKNTGNEPLDISNYTILYTGHSDDPVYTYSLTLEPGAKVYTLSRTGGDHTLQSLPPRYIRHADYNEPILDNNSGTVVVANADSETILKQSYNTRTQHC